MNETVLHCPTPDLRKDDGLDDVAINAGYGLVMDGVQELLRLHTRENFPFLTIYPDPIIEPMPQVLPYQSGLDIQIKVSNISILYCSIFFLKDSELLS